MFRVLLKTIGVLCVLILGILVGFYLGQGKEGLSLPAGSLKGVLPGLPNPPEMSWKELPALKVEAKGNITPKNGVIDLDAVFVSTDPAEGLEAHVHLGGTLEKPQWNVRSLKKKKVRLRFDL